MRLKSLATFIGLAAGVAVCAPLHADTASLVSIRDNTLMESPTGAVSNGIGPQFFVGRTNQSEGEDIRRGLVAFDVSSIPPGSVINSATLRLYMSRTTAPTSPTTVHRVLASWGEGASIATDGGGIGVPSKVNDATWIHRFFDTQTWTTPGGDFTPGASATLNVGGTGYYTWSGAGLVADVQAWVNNAGTNHGWLVRGDESVEHSSKRFETRESANPSLRPLLTINYTPPAVSGACCLSTGCAVLSPAACAAQSGTYQGNGTSCSPNPCGAPTGACCIPGIGCEVLTQEDCESFPGVYQGDGVACSPTLCSPVLTPFVDALPLPGVAQPVSGVPGGAAEYRVVMTEFTQRLHRDLQPTTVWGYNGTYPGPTILARSGQPVTVTWVNQLRDSMGDLRTTHYLPVDLTLHGPDVNGPVPRTVVHLHGGHVPAASDGHPDLAFPPGQESPPYLYPNNQRAATNWYHDHALGLTRLNVYMGLAGFYLISDAEEDALNIPRGAYDVPLVIQDRDFNMDGSLRYVADWQEQFFGDFALVNGKVWPYFEVKRCKYRFRLLNGSGSRVFTLALSNGATMWQIGSDGGLLAAPHATTSVTMAPGERADVVIDFEPYAAGTQLVLTNSAPSPFPNGDPANALGDIMQFRVKPELGDTDPLPGTLATITSLVESQAVTHRDMVLRKMTGSGHDMWLINDLMWDDITERPRVGDVEVWSWINRSGVTHPMHMHLVSFQVLDRQPFEVQGDQIVTTGPRVPPGAGEAGWKDTVQAPPWHITRVIARFGPYTGRFAYHCHVLEHEDHEMMRQFEVVRGCSSADYDGDGDVGTDADIEAFFSCLAGDCCPACIDADFDGDGDVGTDADIEAFFRVLAGGSC